MQVFRLDHPRALGCEGRQEGILPQSPKEWGTQPMSASGRTHQEWLCVLLQGESCATPQRVEEVSDALSCSLKKNLYKP